MKQIRALAMLGLAVTILALAIGCATQVHPNDKLLWEGVDDAPAHAPAPVK